MMPPVLSCLLGRRLCEDPTKDDHWSLRDRCAIITADLCRRYGNSYATLVPRVTKTMVRTLLDPTKPLVTHYGAIAGIAALGPHAVETLLLPHLEAYLAALGSDHSMGDEEKPTQTEIAKVRTALRNAAAKFLAEATEADQAEKRKWVQDLLNL